jgi:hypothetical protein
MERALVRVRQGLRAPVFSKIGRPHGDPQGHWPDWSGHPILRGRAALWQAHRAVVTLVRGARQVGRGGGGELGVHSDERVGVSGGRRGVGGLGEP